MSKTRKNKKNQSRKGYLALLLLLGVTVGFATISTTLNIYGNTTTARQNWSIVYGAAQNAQATGKASNPTVQVTPAGEGTNAKVDFSVTLNEPGDSYTFEIPIRNEGSIDAILKTYTNTELTVAQAKYLDYTVEYKTAANAEAGQEVIAVNDGIQAGNNVVVVVTVTYKKDISAADLPNSTTYPGGDPVFSSSITFGYEQYNSSVDTGVTNKANNANS